MVCATGQTGHWVDNTKKYTYIITYKVFDWIYVFTFFFFRNSYSFTELPLEQSSSTTTTLQETQTTKETPKSRKIWEFYGTEQEEEEVKLSLTSLTTLPAIARKLISSNHVLWVLCAFPKNCPSLTAVVHIRAVSAWCHNLIEWIHVDPLGRRPFLSFDNGASTMKAQWVRDCIWVEVEEQQSIPFPWFHW